MADIKKFVRHHRGTLLIEVVIAAGIIAVAFSAFLRLQSSLLTTKQDGIQKIKATYRAEEALEAVRRLRDGSASPGWVSFTNAITSNCATNCHPVITAGDWSLASNSDTPDSGYTRTITFAEVTRDGSCGVNCGPISGTCPTSGCGDPDTRKVTARVTWGSPTKTVALDMYLTSWKDKVQ